MARFAELSTATKREIAARMIEETAARIGAKCERTRTEKGVINLVVSFGPYCCGIELNASSTWGIIGHWYTEARSDARYSYQFASAIGGSVNEYHFGKATMWGSTALEITHALSRGLAHLAPQPIAA